MGAFERPLKILSPDRLLVWLFLALANACALYLHWSNGAWLFHNSGSIYVHDYFAQWAAGYRVLNGQSALVYNWADFTAFQTTLIGVAKPIKYYAFYPPHFLLTTPLFTRLGPVPAYLAFLATTITLYAVALNLVVRDWIKAAVVAIAGGGAYFCMLWVQNGFLMSALLLAGLAIIPERPRLAGILLGILTIKPQLGILIPFALAAGRHWRTFGWATGTFLILALSAELILGPGIWAAFVRSIFEAVHFLEAGTMWFKMQSPFALALPLLGQNGAYVVQALVAVLAGLFTVRVWRDDMVSHGLKCAALIAGTLLMSPYLFPYDAAVLTGAAMLLIRENPRLPWPDSVALVIFCVLPGFARTLFSAAVPLAAFGMIVLVLRQAERGECQSLDEDGAARAACKP